MMVRVTAAPCWTKSSLPTGTRMRPLPSAPSAHAYDVIPVARAAPPARSAARNPAATFTVHVKFQKTGTAPHRCIVNASRIARCCRKNSFGDVGRLSGGGLWRRYLCAVDVRARGAVFLPERSSSLRQSRTAACTTLALAPTKCPSRRVGASGNRPRRPGRSQRSRRERTRLSRARSSPDAERLRYPHTRCCFQRARASTPSDAIRPPLQGPAAVAPTSAAPASTSGEARKGQRRPDAREFPGLHLGPPPPGNPHQGGFSASFRRSACTRSCRAMPTRSAAR